MTPPRLQRTLVRPATVTGRAYWSGCTTRVEFRPAPPDSGLFFVRDDIATDSPQPIHVDAACRQPASRRTVLANGSGDDVSMVEHVLASLSGLGVDNCEIGVTSAEMPAFDGSALAFVEAIEEAGLVEQGAVAPILTVQKPVRCGDDQSWIEARPPLGGGLTIEYRLDYGPDSPIGNQWLVVDMTQRAFRFEVAAARTFLLESEATALKSQGLGAHVTPKDLMIFRDTLLDAETGEENRQPIDNQLRFSDECVRHKILDVVGDLALAGRPIAGHIVASCSGHRLNGDLVEALIESHPGTPSFRRTA